MSFYLKKTMHNDLGWEDSGLGGNRGIKKLIKNKKRVDLHSRALLYIIVRVVNNILLCT